MLVAKRVVIGFAVAVVVFCVIFLLVEGTVFHSISRDPDDGPAAITANIYGFIAGVTGATIAASVWLFYCLRRSRNRISSTS